MNQRTQKRMTASGIILILCLPVFILLAYNYILITPPKYEGRAMVLASQMKPGEIRQLIRTAQQRLGAVGTVETSQDTHVILITAFSADAEQAANTANIAAQTLVDQGQSRVHVIQPAFVPRSPVSPKKMLVLMGSTMLGTVLAALGLTLIVIARASKTGTLSPLLR